MGSEIVVFLLMFGSLCAVSLTDNDVQETPKELQIRNLIKEIKEMHNELMKRDKITREKLAKLVSSNDSTNHRTRRQANQDSADDAAVCYWNECTQQMDILVPGRKGTPGREGAQGAPGETGPKGDKGFAGSRGIPGARGARSNQKGRKGPKGNKGARGVDGHDGPHGENGAKGEQGPKGERGDDVTEMKTVYTTWGKNDCRHGAQLVYSGYAGGSSYVEEGGGVNYLCLPRNPRYRQSRQDSGQSNKHWRGRIYGAEFKVRNFLPLADINDGDVDCAVCSVMGKSAVLMQPARGTCPTGWTEEYHGYLMAEGHRNHRSEWVCVHHSANQRSTSSYSSESALFYPVEVRSYGSSTGLPSNEYPDGHELTCVVCTR